MRQEHLARQAEAAEMYRKEPAYQWERLGPPEPDDLPMADWVTDEQIAAALSAYDSGVVKDLDEGAP